MSTLMEMSASTDQGCDEFLCAGEIIVEPDKVNSYGRKIWDDRGRLDLPVMVEPHGEMWWHTGGFAERMHSDLPPRVLSGGWVSWFSASKDASVEPSQVRETEYAGVQYSVPMWLEEAYTAAYEKSGE